MISYKNKNESPLFDEKEKLKQMLLKMKFNNKIVDDVLKKESRKGIGESIITHLKYK